MKRQARRELSRAGVIGAKMLGIVLGALLAAFATIVLFGVVGRGDPQGVALLALIAMMIGGWFGARREWRD